jgi:hypothetical protein
MFADRCVRPPVTATPDSLQRARPDKPAERMGVNAGFGDFFAGQHATLGGEPQNPIRGSR